MLGSLNVGGYRLCNGRAKLALLFFAILAIIGMILKQKKPLAGIPGALVTAPLVNRNR